MGDFSWVTAILQLLFGQVGVLGTILLIIAAYIAYLLKQEQEAHAKTRAEKDELNEKRVAFMIQQLSASHEIKVTLDNLIETIKRKRGIG